MSSSSSSNNNEQNLLQLVLAGDVEAVQSRLESGAADVNQSMSNGATAAIVTAFSDDPEGILPVFQLLVKYNADLEATATIGRNVPDMRALHFACAGGRTALAQAMIEAGANVNAVDGHGQTPLLRAMDNRYEAIIDCLLEHGADATIQSSRGATPLILLADPVPDDARVQQDWEKDARIASKMIHANVDVHAIDDEGLSALHWAVQRGHPELAQVLLNEGQANVNIRNSDGQTALFLAIVMLLAESTPASTKERVDRVLDMLVEAGADENIADNTGVSPFKLATSVGRPDLMRRMDRHILEGVDSAL